MMIPLMQHALLLIYQANYIIIVTPNLQIHHVRIVYTA